MPKSVFKTPLGNIIFQTYEDVLVSLCLEKNNCSHAPTLHRPLALRPAACPRDPETTQPLPRSGGQAAGLRVEGQDRDDDALLTQIKSELTLWFQDSDTQFTFPLAPKGTSFQQKVWAALRQIPAGKTLSYGELAKTLGTSARAIGNACRANPITIIIPCHRVVSKNGLGGYAGSTSGKNMEIKSWLLQHESLKT